MIIIITLVLFLPKSLPARCSILLSLKGIIILIAAGLFIGFGTRYASGCTSGHAITGISLLNPASIKSTLMFFAGGAAFTWISYLLFG